MRGRILIAALAALLAAGAGLLGRFYWAMTRPPDEFGRVMMNVPPLMMAALPFETMWKHARRGRLQPGDAAPDFRLPTIDHSQFVQLSSFRGVRPVALVFGSYT